MDYRIMHLGVITSGRLINFASGINFDHMEDLIHLETIHQLCTLTGQKTLHPLICVSEFSQAEQIKRMRISFGFYAVFYKDTICGNIRYGRSNYDYQEGTLVFFAPGQIVGFDGTDEIVQPRGRALLFHPDLIKGTSLGSSIREYNFFSYEANEALHLSDNEKQTVFDCFSKIDQELHHSLDKHSRKLIVRNIELLLDYCLRFYDRQFISRINLNKDIIARFETVLDNYFRADHARVSGLPTVRYCADHLHLSPNYLGDLIKKETGKSPQEHIQLKLIEIAKIRIFDTRKTISEIAYELGFKSSQHFSRLFKQHVGSSPLEYRLS